MVTIRPLGDQQAKKVDNMIQLTALWYRSPS
jgi:hypothetical protein